MHTRFKIQRLETSGSGVAVNLHALQMAAYSHEAHLIGATHFPPLLTTVQVIQDSKDDFFGIYQSDELIGAIGIEFDFQSHLEVSSLVVLPQWHRKGIGRALIQHIVDIHNLRAIRVQTAVLNIPAITLYQRFGFIEVSRRTVGTDLLELVSLERKPGR